MAERDVALVEAIADGLSGEDKKLASELREHMDAIGLILEEKNLFVRDSRGHCDNKVCSLRACLWNSSCSGAACSCQACHGATGGGAVCDSGQRTCGGSACWGNAGGSCVSKVCDKAS